MTTEQQKISYVFIFLFLCAAVSFTQSSDVLSEIPNHFGEIYLGMTLDQVKGALGHDANFKFTGDPDISILHRPNETLLECSGTYFIERAFFQFYNGKLYTIIISLNLNEIDHYGIFTALKKKYGEPEVLDPQKSTWQSDKYILSLERPLMIKYIDRKVLETIRTSGKKKSTLHQLSREQFLGQF